MIKKFALELFLVALFVGLVYLIYSGKKVRDTNDYYTKQAKLDSTINELKQSFDSLDRIEQTYITKETKIINYYETKKDSIRLIPDTLLIQFIRAELGNFNDNGTAKGIKYFN